MNESVDSGKQMIPSIKALAFKLCVEILVHSIGSCTTTGGWQCGVG
jgi:hypothetical protein